jgi:hypothetical protein
MTVGATAQVTVFSGAPISYSALDNNFVAGGFENAFAIAAQPFQTPDALNVQLNAFQFYYAPHNLNDATLDAAIVEWNPASPSAASSPLWTSSPQNTSAVITGLAAPVGNWQLYTFDTSGLVLDPSKTYALVAIQSPTALAGDSDPGSFGVASPIGGSVFGVKTFNASADPGWTILQSTPWGGSLNEMAYSSTFSPIEAVPEPSTVAASALVCLFVVARSCRRKRASS